MKFWLWLLMLQLFVFSAHAEGSSLLNTKDKTALDFERVVVEENLKSKILGVVVPFMPDTRFNLSVSINYKIREPKDTEAVGDSVELGKFGVVAPAVSDELLHQDLISNIGFIRVTFIFYDHIEPEKAEFLTATVKKLVDIVPVWRLRTEMVIPPAPTAKSQPGQYESVKTKTLVGIFIALLVGVALFFGFKRLRDEITAMRSALKEMKSESASEWQTSQDPNVTINFDTNKSYSESSTGPVIVFETQNQSPPSEAINDPPPSYGNAVIPVAIVNQAFEFLAMSTPESEQAIFAALARVGRIDLLEKAARTYFPEDLVLKLSNKTLLRAFGMLDVHEKTGLILSLNEKKRKIFTRSLTEMAKAYFEHELQKLEQDPITQQSIASNSAVYWKQYVDVVRQLLRSHAEFPAEAEDLIQHWIKNKTRRSRRAS